MGRLSGFRYREVVKKLRSFGFVFYRHAAGSHEIWYHPATRLFTTIPNHSGDLPEGTLRAILKQAGVSPEDFLKAS
jgi:predicted RNA binding protein YcfA (HicA-like mRNA interferase family)